MDLELEADLDDVERRYHEAVAKSTSIANEQTSLGMKRIP